MCFVVAFILPFAVDEYCAFALQLHLLELQDLSLLHPHLMSFSRSAGARGVFCGTIVGKSIVLPSGWYHPCSVDASEGGSLLRQSRHVATARCPCNALSRNAASVGGREHSLGAEEHSASFYFAILSLVLRLRSCSRSYCSMPG